MPRLTIDNRDVEVEPGSTVLDAARKLGIDVPTLCFLEGHKPQTSCMACLVKVNGDERLLPSCATQAADAMRVESETDEVRAARRAALELLLSDHLGDCVAPCQAACPAGINIPRAIRAIAAGKKSHQIPAAHCAECGAPCEKVCRRAAKDQPVSIRLLMKYAARQGDAPEPPPAKAKREYSVHVGRVGPDEIDSYMLDASPAGRVAPSRGPDAGFTGDEARREAARCLHCDCRRPDDCRLRKYAALYGARAARYIGARRPFEQQVHPHGVIYEPGKCIACGLCVEITKQAAEPLGLTFVGRGFDLRIAVPFDRPLADALQKVAAECVRACPTGALAFRENTEEP